MLLVLVSVSLLSLVDGQQCQARFNQNIVDQEL